MGSTGRYFSKMERLFFQNSKICNRASCQGRAVLATVMRDSGILFRA